MNYKRFKDKYIVRLEKGEEIVESLTSLARKEKIRLGKVSGIGAVNKAEIGLFSPEIKRYDSKEFNEDLEIISLEGNISEMDNETYIHLHIALGDKDMKVHGGHLNSAYISVTGEFIIDIIDGKVDRELDKEIGVNFLKFE
ncbi:MAG TPA: PPC domain-containing DNA-binding protein [Tissierellaceae bacterium]|nr:PPC domain-containing DNA-binding protein [Tissierellaceae bacterium]